MRAVNSRQKREQSGRNSPERGQRERDRERGSTEAMAGELVAGNKTTAACSRQRSRRPQLKLLRVGLSVRQHSQTHSPLDKIKAHTQ